MRLVRLGLLAALAAGSGLAYAAPSTTPAAPRVIRTKPLRMTGIRPDGRVVQTGKLQMTGIRPQTRTIAVPKLEMTGIEPER